MGMWGLLLFSSDWSRGRVGGSFFWWGCGGFFGWPFLFLFWRVSFLGVLGIFSFFSFPFLSFVGV